MSLARKEAELEANWPSEISNREAKQALADKLVQNLSSGQVIGAGSGTSSYLTLVSLAKRGAEEQIDFAVVATSIEIERTALALGVRVQPLGQSPIDWGFDGADEVDPNGRLIKGRGGAMFREKLVIASQIKTYIVADESKKVAKLGEKFAVPVEVFPNSVDLVRDSLESLGANKAPLRPAGGKDGPVVTEQGGVILDVSFSGDVPPETDLEAIPGVIATGVFDRYDFELLMV